MKKSLKELLGIKTKSDIRKEKREALTSNQKKMENQEAEERILEEELRREQELQKKAREVTEVREDRNPIRQQPNEILKGHKGYTFIPVGGVRRSQIQQIDSEDLLAAKRREKQPEPAEEKKPKTQLDIWEETFFDEFTQTPSSEGKKPIAVTTEPKKVMEGRDNSSHINGVERNDGITFDIPKKALSLEERIKLVKQKRAQIEAEYEYDAVNHNRAMDQLLKFSNALGIWDSFDTNEETEIEHSIPQQPDKTQNFPVTKSPEEINVGRRIHVPEPSESIVNKANKILRFGAQENKSPKGGHVERKRPEPPKPNPVAITTSQTTNQKDDDIEFLSDVTEIMRQNIVASTKAPLGSGRKLPEPPTKQLTTQEKPPRPNRDHIPVTITPVVGSNVGRKLPEPPKQSPVAKTPVVGKPRPFEPEKVLSNQLTEELERAIEQVVTTTDTKPVVNKVAPPRPQRPELKKDNGPVTLAPEGSNNVGQLPKKPTHVPPPVPTETKPKLPPRPTWQDRTGEKREINPPVVEKKPEEMTFKEKLEMMKQFSKEGIKEGAKKGQVTQL